MASKARLGGIIVGVLLAVAAATYVFMTPYNRIAGVRIGGTLTPPPADFTTVGDYPEIEMKVGGFPPFVVNIWNVPDQNGVITATRPDSGYWGKRLRENGNGYIRFGDKTYAMKATEITGDARLPYLEKYGAKYRMPMRYDFTGEIIRGQNEPLYTWEVFYWTPR